MCSSPGSAFLYARREVQHLLELLVVSWGRHRDEPDPKGLPNPSGLARFVDEQGWQVTRDIAGYLSVPAAIQFQAEHDWPRVRAECHELLREVRRRIEEYGRSRRRPCDGGAAGAAHRLATATRKAVILSLRSGQALSEAMDLSSARPRFFASAAQRKRRMTV